MKEIVRIVKRLLELKIKNTREMFLDCRVYFLDKKHKNTDQLKKVYHSTIMFKEVLSIIGRNGNR